MPTYEYECIACGHRFERFQSMTAEPVKTCPECQAAVKRLIGTGAGMILKGSGFHANDYPAGSSAAASCDRETPCCGRDTPCERSPRSRE